MFGIEIKTKWGFNMPVFGIGEKDNKPIIVFGGICEIIIQQTLWGNNVIFYKVRDMNTDNFYIIKEEHIALNRECLEEMINNGEVSNEK